MPEHFTIVATWGRAIATALESYGYDSQTLFDELDLDHKLSYDPTARYPLDRISQLLQRSVQITGDDAFGLKVSRCLPSTYLPALNILVAASDNMLEGFVALCRFHQTINDGFALELHETPSSVYLEYRMVKPGGPLALAGSLPELAAEAIDAGFAGMVGNVRSSLDPDFTAKCVHFRRAKPENDVAFQELFRAPIRYGQAFDSLEFDRQTLTAPLASANRELAKLNEQVLQSLVESSDRKQFLTEVQLHIINQLSRGEPLQEDIANALNLSSRQLRRRLQQLDCGYAQLLERTRHDLAKKYLLQKSLSVSDITQLLGFSDQSNFSKAFKRWEGESPVNFRRRTLEQL